MNTGDFVTYKQALALKRLGFNLEVNHCYISEDKLVEVFYDNESGDEPTSYGNFNKYETALSAPTLAQAHKWLRSKGLWVETHPEPFDAKGWEFDIYNLKGDYYYSFAFSTVYDTYEKALSDGITECVKILEKECQS